MKYSCNSSRNFDCHYTLTHPLTPEFFVRITNLGSFYDFTNLASSYTKNRFNSQKILKVLRNEVPDEKKCIQKSNSHSICVAVVFCESTSRRILAGYLF